MEVRHVDLLVHPGFSFYGSDSKELSPGYGKLWARYAERAGHVRRNAQHILIANMTPNAFAYPDRESEGMSEDAVVMRETRKHMEKLLGDRFVSVMSQQFQETDTEMDNEMRDKFFENLDLALRERNFKIGYDVHTLAYGETAAYCVPGFAYNFYIHYLLSDSVDVDLRLTNVGVKSNESIKKQNRRLRKKVGPHMQYIYDRKYDKVPQVLPIPKK